MTDAPNIPGDRALAIVTMAPRESVLPEYRLYATRCHDDGSFETPSVVLTVRAPSHQAAIAEAARHPVEAYGDAMDVTWLTDRDGVLLWTFDARLPKAA